MSEGSDTRARPKYDMCAFCVNVYERVDIPAIRAAKYMREEETEYEQLRAAHETALIASAASKIGVLRHPRPCKITIDEDMYYDLSGWDCEQLEPAEMDLLNAYFVAGNRVQMQHREHRKMAKSLPVLNSLFAPL